MLINLHQDTLHSFHPTGELRERASGMVVQGPLDVPIIVHQAEQRRLCGVSFSPGGAFTYFGGVVTEIVSGLVDLNRLSWNNQSALHENLTKVGDPDTRLDVLEAALVEREPNSTGWDNLMFQASAMLQNRARVHNVAKHFDVSNQTLIHRFRERTGLTSKTFSRIERFQRLLRNQRDTTSWSEAALEAGYSDQSNMVREFRCFAGLSPTEYALHRKDHQNHVTVAA